VRTPRRKVIVVVLVLVVVPLCALFFLGGPPDPLYHGLPLSQWLVPWPSMTFHLIRKAPPATNVTTVVLSAGFNAPAISPTYTMTYYSNWMSITYSNAGTVSLSQTPVPISVIRPSSSFSGLQETTESRIAQAVRGLGTNAIPTLLGFLRANETSWKSKLVALSRKQNFIQVDYSPAFLKNTAAAIGFASLGDEASNAAPDLVKILERNYSSASQKATLDSLNAIGPAAEKANPTLMRLAGDTNCPARFLALHTLAVINPHAETLMPFLIKCLSDTDPRMRTAAVRELVRYGPEARPAVPALVRLLGDPSSDAQGNANVTLYYIGPKDSLPALIAAVNDPNPVVRDNAIHGISMFGADAQPALPVLNAALNDPDPKIRERAAIALKQIQAALK
jgi:HEAT repeat protein